MGLLDGKVGVITGAGRGSGAQRPPECCSSKPRPGAARPSRIPATQPFARPLP